MEAGLVGEGGHFLLRASETGVKGALGGGRRGTDTAQERERGIPNHVTTGATDGFGALGESHAVVLHGIEEFTPLAREAIGDLSREATGDVRRNVRRPDDLPFHNA